MRITFLGTGTSQGVPVIACSCPVCTSTEKEDKRLRTSIHIEYNSASIVVDSGPDFRQQMLRENIRKLDAILFTHQHKDHTGGMDDVRAFNYFQQKPMPVYGRIDVLEQLKKEFSYAFEREKYPGVPQIILQEITNQEFIVEDIRITPIEVLHYQLPVFGFRIDDFVYITDANYISEIEKQKIKGCEVLVLNALQKQDHISHFTLAEAIELVEEIKPAQAYLTHISHRMGLHAEVQKDLPSNTFIAYDGLKIEI